VKKAVIATTTLAKDPKELRVKLALKTIKKAVECGYQIVVVDGSPDEVREQFGDIGAIVCKDLGQSMGASRRQAISKAAKIANGGVVIWMEPEKHTLIPELLKAVVPFFLPSAADLVVPTRKSMASYPPEQQYAEPLGNLAFFHLTKHALDLWFGPRVMGERAMPYFLNYQGEYGDRWDSIFIPVLRIIKDNLRVMSVVVDYAHPEEQTAKESNFNFLTKRLEQLTNLVPSMEQEARKLGLIA